MAAIVGKKLGMTQVFHEDGTRVPVTVIEAEPNTVTAVRIPERDGYAAVQLAAIATEERKLTKAELGHLKKAGAPASRTLVEFRDEAPEAQIGEVVTVEQFEPGQRVKVSAHLGRQGLPGHDQAPQLQPRPGLARLPQRPRAGFDRRQRRPRARVQGRQDAGPDGRPSASPSAGSRSSRSTPSATCCCSGARSPGPKAAPWRCAAMASKATALKATTLGKQAKTDLPRDRLRRGVPRVRSSTRPRARTSRPAGAAPPPRSAAARSR